MTTHTLHKISFQFKNDVEVLFQGDDQVLHVLNDYRSIFSLCKSPALAPTDRYTIILKNQPDCDYKYNLTEYHFDLIRFKHIEITYNFQNEDPDDYAGMLMMFSLLLGSVAQQYGGGLIHAALGELNCRGFLMAAPGGTGKTTASNRLPAPFISHCDDTTLLVRGNDGNYWAHPFPTWSRFYWGGSGGSWKFDQVLLLKTIFYLSQSETDFVTELNHVEKVSRCVAGFEQVSRMLTRNGITKDKVNSKGSIAKIRKRINKDWFAISGDLDQDAFREIRIQWFENALIVMKQLPAYKLNLSLTCNFWKLIEKYLLINFL